MSNPITKIVTHINVDTDAAMSVGLYMYLFPEITLSDVSFVHANETDIPEDAIALDIKAGIKGDHSCFSTLVEELIEKNEALYEILKPFCQFVNSVDSGEFVVTQPVWIRLASIPAMIASLRSSRMTDKQICEVVATWLKGYIQMQLRQRKMNEDVKKAPTLLDGRIVIVEKQGNSNAAFTELDAQFVVYADGNNVGVIRNAKLKEPHLPTLLRHRLPNNGDGFYCDDRGFLVCWGSRKAPAKSPAPISAMDLGKLLEDAIRLSEVPTMRVISPPVPISTANASA